MPVSNPYFRIYRPAVLESIFSEDTTVGYIQDHRYIEPREKSSLLSAARLILKDYEDLLEYVEPCDNNLKTYSHRIYELLLRACTEVEANLEGMLKANGYRKPGNKNLNMDDYRKVEKATKLSDYSVALHLWHPEKIVRPFEAWKTADESLSWYRAYNEVKHERSMNFDKASLENLSQSICGLLCILTSQFGYSVEEADNHPSNMIYCDETDTVAIGHFSISLPSFQESEKYLFDWEKIKDDSEPFNTYEF